MDRIEDKASCHGSPDGVDANDDILSHPRISDGAWNGVNIISIQESPDGLY